MPENARTTPSSRMCQETKNMAEAVGKVNKDTAPSHISEPKGRASMHMRSIQLPPLQLHVSKRRQQTYCLSQPSSWPFGTFMKLVSAPASLFLSSTSAYRDIEKSTPSG